MANTVRNLLTLQAGVEVQVLGHMRVYLTQCSSGGRRIKCVSCKGLLYPFVLPLWMGAVSVPAPRTATVRV